MGRTKQYFIEQPTETLEKEDLQEQLNHQDDLIAALILKNDLLKREYKKLGTYYLRSMFLIGCGLGALAILYYF